MKFQFIHISTLDTLDLPNTYTTPILTYKKNILANNWNEILSHKHLWRIIFTVYPHWQSASSDLINSGQTAPASPYLYHQPLLILNHFQSVNKFSLLKTKSDTFISVI